MSNRRSLSAKLWALVLLPLVGALVFAVFGYARLSKQAAHLETMHGQAALLAEFGQLQNLLRRERGALNNLGHGGSVTSVRAQIAAADAVALRARQIVERSADFAADSAIRRAADAVFAAYARLDAPRRALAGGRGTAEQLAVYPEVSRAIVAFSRELAGTADSVALRARLDGWKWFGELLRQADEEEIVAAATIHEARTSMGMLIEVAIATKQRRALQQYVSQMAPPELWSYWQETFADPAYLRADELVDALYDSRTREPVPPDAKLVPEWLAVAQGRARLLESVPRRLGEDLDAHLTSARALNRRETNQLLALFGGLTILSLALAAWRIRLLDGQFARSVTELTAGASATAGAIHESTATIEQLATATIEEGERLGEMARFVAELKDANQHTSTHAETGVSRVTELESHLGAATSLMKTLAETITGIDTTSRNTIRIVKTIDEIAFQTNILALNASVESARAGDAGTGFSVVAEEVRSLAQRVSAASAETARLVEEARSGVGRGLELRNAVEAAIGEVTANTTKARALLGEIQHATREMKGGIEQIGTAAPALQRSSEQTGEIAAEARTAIASTAAATEAFGGAVSKLEAVLARTG